MEEAIKDAIRNKIVELIPDLDAPFEEDQAIVMLFRRRKIIKGGSTGQTMKVVCGIDADVEALINSREQIDMTDLITAFEEMNDMEIAGEHVSIMLTGSELLDYDRFSTEGLQFNVKYQITKQLPGTVVPDEVRTRFEREDEPESIYPD